jgi:glycosyltransferase involved in cell wall biosynthesis
MKNILVATNNLTNVGGTETFTYTLIEELVKRNIYNVEYFSFKKGMYSEKIENDFGIEYFKKKDYDLILANHKSCVDFLYGKGFIIQTCHGVFPSLEQPSIRADAFVSISEEVKKHLKLKGFDSTLILNGINLNKFKVINPVSKSIKKLLSLCHSDEANEFLKKVCSIKNIEFIKAYKYKNPVLNVEKIMNHADIVVGLGRSAYEAMACGRPVIVYDKRDYFESYSDGYVKDILDLSIEFNCSGRYLKRKIVIDDFLLEIEKFDTKDSLFFRNFAIANFCIEKTTDKYLEVPYSLEGSKNKFNSKPLLEVLKSRINKLRLSFKLKFYYNTLLFNKKTK